MGDNKKMDENEKILKDCTASFEIEGIEVTSKMLEDGMKILKGEATQAELVAIYIESLKRK